MKTRGLLRDEVAGTSQDPLPLLNRNESADDPALGESRIVHPGVAEKVILDEIQYPLGFARREFPCTDSIRQALRRLNFSRWIDARPADGADEIDTGKQQ